MLVAALENEGVERIFGIPGEENLDVVKSLRSSRIELVLTRHEQAASFMAATYGHGPPGRADGGSGADAGSGLQRRRRPHRRHSNRLL